MQTTKLVIHLDKHEQISRLNMPGDQGTLDSSLGAHKNHFRRQASSFGPVVFKSAELLICIICIGLFDDPANNSRFRTFVGTRTIALSYSTFGTFTTVCLAFLIAKALRDNVPWKYSTILNLAGFFGFAACAVVIFKDWSDTKERNYWPPNTTRLDLTCASGALSTLNAVVFLVDSLFVMRLGARGDLP
ncbi:CLUMA_CG012606, isoform A [Clunio marinus]|uniref:CLUMA_CG012606, isoform A n=1 Tax=Clunio marinus TaxID=568069 RepID=A0A1J1IGE0_9DIPT|nr:CLUMA_CG012606, isoform A [Clunio marinus]